MAGLSAWSSWRSDGHDGQIVELGQNGPLGFRMVNIALLEIGYSRWSSWEFDGQDEPLEDLMVLLGV